MVCIRCKMVVKDELERLGLHYTSIELGEADVNGEITPEKLSELNAALKKSGLELMDDKKSQLIEKIKNIVVEMVHYSDESLTINFSEFLSRKLNYDYNYLSNLFTEVQGRTLESFIIAHKIERVKELLVYKGLTLTEIAHLLHYSSVAHLSTQFKKVTGLTPTHFKKLKDKRFIGRENL